MNSNSKMTYSQLYGQAGLTYIRFDAPVETKPSGQKKIGAGNRPAFSKIVSQPTYGKGDGRYYSLLMGREFKPGRFVLLLDFDNKQDEDSKNGLELIKLLKVDERGAPEQKTPSGGYHYLFYVEADQADQITSKTGLFHNGVKYNADVKFKNSLCNCQPSKIEDYGKYQWSNPYQLLDIPKLPSDLFELIRNRAPSPPSTPRSGNSDTYQEPPTATEKELEDIRELCKCLSASQLDDYATWVRLGMILKKLGAPLSLWDELSKTSKKYKRNDCSSRWPLLKPRNFTIGSLIVLAKAGNLEKYNKLKPDLNMNNDVFHDDQEYSPVVINTPFLTTKANGEEPTEAQKTFKDLTESFMEEPSKKTLIVKSRYGSGKTTFLQRLIKERNLKRVLFITYRQTLARDIMRNFSKLGFKNYLDAPDHPEVWNSPKLIVQVDSLLNVLFKNVRFICEDRFNLNYDMIVLDESESLLCHFDEKTMENKEIQIWNFFDELLKHSNKVVLMDGDISKRSLSFAKSYGEMTYIKNVNTDVKQILHLMQDEAKWEKQLFEDLQNYYSQDQNFKVCVVSQSSSKAVALEREIKERAPHLKVLRLVGTDSGQTKKDCMEDINETLKDVNVFLYSPVIESGVDITIPIKKVFGVLCGKSNCQRAYLQMLARCRNVENPRIDLLNDPILKINSNFNFWKFDEVMELHRQTVQHTSPEFLINGNFLELSDNERNQRRKTISIYNTVERLNKHPSIFINYLRVLASAKGMGFEVQQLEEGEKPTVSKPKNYKISAVLEAPDITSDEFEELSAKKKQGKTTTDQNTKVDKHFWQRFLATKELDEAVLKAFMFEPALLRNFLSLIDIKNYEAQDNLKSAQHLQKVELVKNLLFGLGFASAVDGRTLDREALATNFVCNICDDPAFKQRKHINELFDLRKEISIHQGMTTQQVLVWCNSLLKQFSIRIKSLGKHGEGYRLEVLNDVLGIIKRKNANDRFFEDRENLLQQENRQGDPFLDEATGETLPQKRERARAREMREFDTSGLDRGVVVDED